ncbi:MAG TPA: YtxH domain-containing protein [Elusimicrobiota bacterium]|nr:YtxH domain-containing protein [Elusimicrobiota bacterium]
MSENNKGGDTLIAFLLGGLVGAGIAFLFAPRAGKETRRRLQHWLEDMEDKGQDLLEEGRELLQEGKEVVQEKTEKIKRVIDSGRKAWDEHTKN